MSETTWKTWAGVEEVPCDTQSELCIVAQDLVYDSDPFPLKVFDDYSHDQYDFHFYALRRFTIGAYFKYVRLH